MGFYQMNDFHINWLILINKPLILFSYVAIVLGIILALFIIVVIVQFIQNRKLKQGTKADEESGQQKPPPEEGNGDDTNQQQEDGTDPSQASGGGAEEAAAQKQKPEDGAPEEDGQAKKGEAEDADVLISYSVQAKQKENPNE